MSIETVYAMPFDAPPIYDNGGAVFNVKHRRFAGGAKGDGTTDDRAAFVAVEAEGDHGMVPAGTYSIASNLTLSKAWTLMKGAKIKPASGITVTISGPFDAGLHQAFDTSAGGTVAFGARAVSHVWPEWWGAAGDGSTDDAAAVRAAFTTGRPVHGAEGATYRLGSKVTAPSSGDIVIRNLRLRPDAALTGDGALDHGASSLASTTLAGTSYRVGAQTITVSSTTGMVAGAIVTLESDEDWPYDSGQPIKRGETQRIKSVDSSTQITLAAGLFCPYNTASETVTVTCYAARRAVIDGLEIEFPSLAEKNGFVLFGCTDVEVSNVSVKNAGHVGFSVQQCYNTSIKGGALEDCYLSGLGYGIQLVGCTLTTVTGTGFYRCRHGIDVSGGWPSHATQVTGCTGVNHESEGGCFSTHGAANLTSFVGNTVIGGPVGFIVRGPQTMIQGNQGFGCGVFCAWAAGPGLQLIDNFFGKAPLAGAADPDSINIGFLDITDALDGNCFDDAAIGFTVTGNISNTRDYFIFLAESLTVAHGEISRNHAALENSGGPTEPTSFMESSGAGAAVASTVRIADNHVRNVVGDYDEYNLVSYLHSKIEAHTSIATASVGHVGYPAPTSLTNGQIFTFDMGLAGPCLFVISDGSSAQAALVFADYVSSTITLVANPSSYFEASSTPAAGKIGIYKSANDETISIENNVGSTRSVAICVLGNHVNALTAPA